MKDLNVTLIFKNLFAQSSPPFWFVMVTLIDTNVSHLIFFLFQRWWIESEDDRIDSSDTCVFSLPVHPKGILLGDVHPRCLSLCSNFFCKKHQSDFIKAPEGLQLNLIHFPWGLISKFSHRVEPTTGTSFNLNYLFKGPVSKYLVMDSTDYKYCI